MPALNYPQTARHNMRVFVPEAARRVLDVGCNTGTFGAALKERGPVEVWGVEPWLPAAELAARVLDKVVTTPFDAEAEIPEHHFDAIVFNDVLEHMVDPWQALHLAKTKLAPGGIVVASIPNIRQIDNLIHLIRDKDFEYQKMGIRDQTHLRFFTQRSATRLFQECGYSVLRSEGINEDWWTSSLLRRVAFRMFSRQLWDTKFTQFAFVAEPRRS